MLFVNRNRRWINYIITILFLLAIPILIYQVKKSRIFAAWYDNNYNYRKPITLTNAGTTLTNHDVVITLDTNALVASGKMQADCDDIRVTDEDELTPISYWVEGNCNTTTTQIWARVPSIPNGTHYIYVYYGNSSAVNAEQSWTGNFTLLYNNTCPTGWTRNANYDTRFPYGSSINGTDSGNSTHNHGGAHNTTLTYTLGGGARWQSSGSGNSLATYNHTHSMGTTVNSQSLLPSYLEMVYCYNPDLTIASGLITFFDVSAPTGWTRFSSLDNKFPRGASSYGGTGGGDSHTHSSSITSCGGASASNSAGSGVPLLATLTHYHTWNGDSTCAANAITCGSGDLTPSYLDMVIASASAATYAPQGAVAIVDVIPPLGWTRYTDLDSKFPRGAASHGGTGGAASHTHACNHGAFNFLSGSFTTNAVANVAGNLCTAVIGSGYHEHGSLNYNATSENNLPLYRTTIFAQKNTPSATTSVGSETGRIVIPNTPTNCVIDEGDADTSLTVRWTDNATDEDNYTIDRSVNGGAWSNLSSTLAANTVSYQDSAIATGNTYAYRMAATNASGSSLYCGTTTLNLGVGNFNFEGVNLEGINID